MGFIDALKAMFSEKKPIETIELKFSQIDVFVSQHADKLKEIEQKAQKLKQDLMDKFKRVRLLLEQLKRAEPAQNISASKICVVGDSIRDKFYENGIRAINSLPDGVQDFYIESQNAFKVLNLDMRKADILLMVFKNEMSDFSNALVSLKKELDIFKKFVKRDLIVIRKYDQLKEILVKTKEHKSDISKSETGLSKVKSELDFYESKKQSIIRQLEELQEAKTSKEVKELNKEAEDLENKNKVICDEVDTKFSELRKILKKFKYLVDQEMYSANKRKINEYVQSPSQALLADYKLEIIPILNELKRALGKDIKMELKHHKQTQLIIEFLTREYFNEKKKAHKFNYDLLQENYSQKTQILTPLVFKERALEGETKAIDRNLDQVQKDYDKQDKILTRHKELLDNNYKQLSTLISEVTSLPVIVAD